MPFTKGHKINAGKKRPLYVRIKLAEAKMGENNPAWKGEKVGYYALHIWAKRRKKKPKYCESCKKEGWMDLANISQEYKRDLADWEYLCRKCHMERDGRLGRFSGNQLGKISWSKGLTKDDNPILAKVSEGKMGKLNPNWKGGISLQPRYYMITNKRRRDKKSLPQKS